MSPATQAKFTNPAKTGEAALAAALAEMDKQVVTKIMGNDVTRGELSAAFSRVQNRDHWKGPIDVTASFTDYERLETAEAIAFFTGSVANFTLAPNGKWRLRAAGYYAVIGA